MRIELCAEIIGACLRRAPLAVERYNLVEQGKRLRIAAPRERSPHLLVRIPYPPSIENL